MESIKIKRANDGKHKLVAEFSLDGRTRRVKFGAAGYGDYPTYVASIGREEANKKRAQYIARHRPRERWDDPTTAGFWARRILWNKPTIEASLKKVKQLKLVSSE